MTTIPPELSIIIPVLNDTAELSELLNNLADQDGVNFEVDLCDGDSANEAHELLSDYLLHGCFELRVIKTTRGRGIQMNAGAAAAVADTLLFLHADSRFTDKNALLSGIATYKNHQSGSTVPSAARFKLGFRRSNTNSSLPYYYHEAKACLNRGDCIRGDQGYMIDRKTFEQFGRFDCSLPFLEDVRLAKVLAEKGQWLLLPAEISTSARRFEQEGFYERQVLNVIIVNALETGWNELLEALPGLYCCNSASGRLSLFPLLDGTRSMISNHEKTWQSSFWQATGAHVAANAWQIFFWLDVRRSFRCSQKADEIETFWLQLYEQHCKSLFESRMAARLAGLLTRIWLWWMLRTTVKNRHRNSPDLTETS